MDFAIVNPSAKVTYADIPTEHLRIIEDVLLRPSAQASESLIELATSLSAETNNTSLIGDSVKADGENVTSLLSVEERLMSKLQKGIMEGLESDLQEALATYPKAVDIIEGPLMSGMNRVGQLFGEGKMFLPQVVKTARTMKRAVSILQPHIESQKSMNNGSSAKVLLATVKGDVHDIGKNIVSVVMACNGYEIIDMGVMVPPEKIVKAALEHSPDAIGLSGLITPSLAEMVEVVSKLSQAGITVPVMIGGATTSVMHTALKIAPHYQGPVLWVKDASQNCPMLAQFLNPLTKDKSVNRLNEEYEMLRRTYQPQPIVPIEDARRNKPNFF